MRKVDRQRLTRILIDRVENPRPERERLPEPTIISTGGGGGRRIGRRVRVVLRLLWDQALWITPLALLISTLISRYT